MKILSATIIKGYGADKIFLTTDLKEACYPFEGSLLIHFDTAHNTGYAYLKNNFDLSDDNIKIVEI